MAIVFLMMIAIGVLYLILAIGAVALLALALGIVHVPVRNARLGAVAALLLFFVVGAAVGRGSTSDTPTPEPTLEEYGMGGHDDYTTVQPGADHDIYGRPLATQPVSSSTQILVERPSSVAAAMPPDCDAWWYTPAASWTARYQFELHDGVFERRRREWDTWRKTHTCDATSHTLRP